MLSKIKLKIMIKAFPIRLNAGESFDEIAEIYPALTADDLAEIRKELKA